jgi:hypothetical protein
MGVNDFPVKRLVGRCDAGWMFHRASHMHSRLQTPMTVHLPGSDMLTSIFSRTKHLDYFGDFVDVGNCIWAGPSSTVSNLRIQQASQRKVG